MFKVDLSFLQESDEIYRKDLVVSRRKSSSAISINSSGFGNVYGSGIYAELIPCKENNPLRRTRSSCTTSNGFFFQFGGYDGEKYYSDLQVFTEKPIMEQFFGLPKLENFSKSQASRVYSRLGASVKVIHSSGHINYQKYWLLLRFRKAEHPLARQLYTQHSIDLSFYSKDVVEDSFSSILRGTWPAHELSVKLLDGLYVSSSDLILSSDVTGLIDRMRTLEVAGTCCISMDSLQERLHIDAAWIAQYSGFFSEYLTFSKTGKEHRTVHSMNKAFLSLLKLLLVHHFGYDYRDLHQSELFEAFDMADYLVCPSILKVAQSDPALYTPAW